MFRPGGGGYCLSLEFGAGRFGKFHSHKQVRRKLNENGADGRGYESNPKIVTREHVKERPDQLTPSGATGARPPLHLSRSTTHQLT